MMAMTPGRTNSAAGDDAARGPVQQPADIGGELLRLGAGQQHAVVERVQEPVLADPALLLDQDAVHDRDLPGRAAEGERGDAQPRPATPRAKAMPCAGDGRRRSRRRRDVVMPSRSRLPALAWSASCGSRRWRRGTSGRRRRRAPCRPRAARGRRHTCATGRARRRAGPRASGARSSRAGVGAAHDRRQPQQRRGREPELLDHDVEGAELAAMAPEHVSPSMSKGVASKRSATPGTSAGGDEQEHRVRIDEAADQPGAGDAVDLRPRARHPDGAALRVARRQLVAGHQRQPGRGPAERAAFERSRPATPACRSQAATPWLSFSPFWQIDDGGAAAANSGAQSATSRCERRTAPGIRRGSAAKSSSVRTSIRARAVGPCRSGGQACQERCVLSDDMAASS